MLARVVLFSAFNSDSTVPAGNFSNAALVGAKTVNGPSPLSVSASPAAFTAVTNVLKSGFPAAISTMFCVGSLFACHR